MRSPDSAPLELFAASNYRVTGLLHESPQTRLYRAFDRHNGDPVVVKCFDAHTGPAYLREVAAGLDLAHENIVCCLDTFQSESSAGCIVYEWMEGPNLAQYLESHLSLSAIVVRRCLGDLAKALAYMHGRGRMHCDLKPENIYVGSSLVDDEPRFILGDLGSVCTIREAAGGTHTAGTPAYIAPERIYDRFFANSDLYSLGVLGFELITGLRPFRGTTDEVIRAHLSQAPPMERVKDEGLREILEHLLEKDPLRRIQSADTLLMMLGQPASGTAEKIGKSAAARPHQRRSLENLRVDGHQYGEYRLQSHATSGKLAALLGAKPDQVPTLLVDHGGHAEVLGLAADFPLRVFGKIGSMDAAAGNTISYASSNRVFRIDYAGGRSGCAFEHCRGLIHHVLAEDHLFWQSRAGMHYVQLSRNKSYSFRSDAYVYPSHAVVFPGGGFCYSDGVANQCLFFRTSETEILFTHSLAGPVLGLSNDGDRWLAAAANLARPGSLQIACGSLDQRDLRTTELDLAAVDWCCVAGRLFWIAKQGGLYAIDCQLKPQRVARSLPEATTLVVSADSAWLALQNTRRDPGRVALWKLNS